MGEAFLRGQVKFLDLTFSFSIDDFLDLGGAFINIEDFCRADFLRSSPLHLFIDRFSSTTFKDQDLVDLLFDHFREHSPQAHDNHTQLLLNTP